jgi:hypothetical protein
MMEGTPFYLRKRDDPDYEPGMKVTKWDGRHGLARHEIATFASPAHRRAKRRLLAAVHAINRREVRSSARMFDGMM